MNVTDLMESSGFWKENHDTFCFRQFSSGSGNVIPPAAGKAGVHPVTYLT